VLVTHFMDEAERLCDRSPSWSRGRIVALDTPQGLIAANSGGVVLRFTPAQPGRGGAGRTGGEPDDLDWLARVPHVRSVVRRGSRVEVTGEGPVLTHVAAALLEHGLEPFDLRAERPTLEETYLKLTGHWLE
jgi:ABC-2 type transport system ATP-binding protein